MRVLFVNSGAGGFHSRYAYDIYTTLTMDFHYIVRQIAPGELSTELLRSFRPNVLLVIHGTYTPLRFIRQAKNLKIVTVLWLVEDPYEIDQHRGDLVRAYDLVFTNERQAVAEYRQVPAFYLPWCCNPRVHHPLEVPPEYHSDLCFVGMGFANRIRILNEIAPLLKNLQVVLIGNWEIWGAQLHRDLQRFVLPTADDFWEVQKYYNGAKINLNIHRDPVDPPFGNRKPVRATSPNDRVFALAGCGAFQIVDRSRPDLWQAFGEEREIIGFTQATDLADQIERFLGDAPARQEIGRAAQQKAYQAHTYQARLSKIFSQVTKFLKRNDPSLTPNRLKQPSFYSKHAY